MLNKFICVANFVQEKNGSLLLFKQNHRHFITNYRCFMACLILFDVLSFSSFFCSSSLLDFFFSFLFFLYIFLLSDLVKAKEILNLCSTGKTTNRKRNILYGTFWLIFSTQNKGVESENKSGTDARPRYSEMKQADKWP